MGEGKQKAKRNMLRSRNYFGQPVPEARCGRGRGNWGRWESGVGNKTHIFYMDESNASKNLILESIPRSGLGRINQEFMVRS